MERLYRKCYKYVLTQITIILSVMCLLTITTSQRKFAYADCSSSYAVIDVNTLDFIESNNGDKSLPMASTTKIMTALVIIENCINVNELVEIGKESVGIEGSSVYLKEGETLTVKELLYCMMLRSGNDSATALALYLAKSISDFAEIMNYRSESMGLTNTHFVNPHGLHDDNHYTSAKDLAYISAIAMKNSLFKEIVGTKSIKIGNGENTRVLSNKNKMLNLYEGANGIKTGYTKKSGRCLVSSAERNGKSLVCVVLNYGDTYGLSKALLDKAFLSLNAKNA